MLNKNNKPIVYALIPARSGSKGVPHKNIRRLGGYSLLHWSIAVARNCKCIDKIIVSTDSNEYAEQAKKCGAEVPFIRPKEISGDSANDYDFVSHALEFFLQKNTKPDYIVHLRPTTPLRNPDLICEAVNVFLNNSNASSLRSVHEMGESAYKTFEINNDGKLKRIASNNTDLDSANNARQIFPTTYVANGYVDVLSTKFITNYSMLHGNHVIPFITPVSYEVDSEDDFSLLEYQILKDKTYLDKIFKKEE